MAAADFAFHTKAFSSGGFVKWECSSLWKEENKERRAQTISIWLVFCMWISWWKLLGGVLVCMYTVLFRVIVCSVFTQSNAASTETSLKW